MIYVKVANTLNDMDRSIRWLANKSGINYSTLYNFAHNKTCSVNFEIIDKLCKQLDCDVCDIIKYIPDKEENK